LNYPAAPAFFRGFCEPIKFRVAKEPYGVNQDTARPAKCNHHFRVNPLGKQNFLLICRDLKNIKISINCQRKYSSSILTSPHNQFRACFTSFFSVMSECFYLLYYKNDKFLMGHDSGVPMPESF
jgi:hypothetical protein